MTRDRKEQGSKNENSGRSISQENFRRDIDFNEKRKINEVVDTLSPPPRRDKGNGNGGDNN